MSNIEVGEYIRTKSGLILKTKYVHVNYISVEKPYKKGNIITNRVWNEDITKHSKNIIDLIEVGDYVNGYEVMNIYKPRDIWEPIEIEIDSKCTRCFLASEIKSIVTKEQFKEMEYRING